MMNAQTLLNMLSEHEKEPILKGLTILFNHPRAGFLNTVSELARHRDSQISALASKLAEKLENFEKHLDHAQKIENTNDFVTGYKATPHSIGRKKLIEDYEEIPQDRISDSDYEDLLSIYLFETNRDTAVSYSRMMSRRFQSRFQADLLKSIVTDNSNVLVNSMIGLMNYENQIGVETIADIYQNNDIPEFIYFSSCYLWKYSKLLVCSKLKELARKETNLRSTVAKTCIAIADSQLSGIVTLLLEDPVDKIKALARTAFNAIEKKVTTAEDFIKKHKSLTSDFSTKFENILKNSKDFHEKILVTNILDNLGQSDFIPLIKECLEREKNNFVIASYVKFIGKFGQHEHIDLLRPYMDSNDNRIVANCIEGLAYGPVNSELIDYFRSKINSEDYRVSLMSAFALWKYGDQMIVHKFFKKNALNKSIWKRKALLKLLMDIQDHDLKEYAEIMLDDPDEEIKQDAAEFLNRMQDVDVKEKFSAEEIIDYIIEQGKIPDNIIMKNIRLLSSENPLSVKLKAARELAYLATDEHYTYLYKCYINASDPLLKAELVKTIGYTFSEGKEFLLDKLQEEKDERILIHALEGLGNYDIRNDLKIVFAFLSHETPVIIQVATRLLKQYIPEELPVKIGSMLKSPNSDIRRCALYAISELLDFENYLIVRKMLNDRDLNVAITASEVLKKFDVTDEFKDKLRQRLSRENEESDRMRGAGQNTGRDKKDSVSCENRSLEQVSSLLSSDSTLDRKQGILSFLESAECRKYLEKSAGTSDKTALVLSDLLAQALNLSSPSTAAIPKNTLKEPHPSKMSSSSAAPNRGSRPQSSPESGTGDRKRNTTPYWIVFIMLVAIAGIAYYVSEMPDQAQETATDTFTPQKISINKKLEFFNKFRRLAEDTTLDENGRNQQALLLLVSYSHLFNDEKYEKYRTEIVAGRFSKVLADQ